MRTLLKVVSSAALTLALLTGAHAQNAPTGAGAAPSPDGMSGGKHRGRGGQKAQQQEEQKPKVDEKGYRSAIERLPDQPYDPWRNAR